MARGIKVKWLGLAVVAAGAASAFACSGAEFCQESRTCPSSEDAAAGSAGAPDVESGGSASANEGGAGAQVSSAGGDGGQPQSTVGNPCTKDSECDDKDSCTGAETCVDGACVAGEAVECPSGLQCSAAKNNACVFASDAPWIVYTAAVDTPGVNELYAIKSDLIGVADAVKISPPLATGWQLNGVANWSDDGSRLAIGIGSPQLKRVESYLVRFGDGLPERPLALTDGMPASTLSNVSWSPSGKLLALVRDDGVHAVEVNEDGKVSEALASGAGYTATSVWIKSDNELIFYGKGIVSGKFGFYLAQRSGSIWSQQLIAAVPKLNAAYASPDRSILGYLVIESPSNQMTFWILEAMAASTPKILIGPAADLAFAPSHDGARLLQCSTNGATGKTDVRGGERSDLFGLPLLEGGVGLSASQILPLAPASPWAPDSSSAFLFQDSGVGRQLVMHQPNAASPWSALPFHQLTNDLWPVWAPDSTLLALPTRAEANSDAELTLVAADGTTNQDIDSVAGGSFRMFGFSSGAELFAYAKGTGSAAINAYYVDLRGGIDAPLVPAPIDDPIDWLTFATRGTGAIYSRAGKGDCHYLDLAASPPTSPVAINGGKPVVSCSFQKLAP